MIKRVRKAGIRTVKAHEFFSFALFSCLILTDQIRAIFQTDIFHSCHTMQTPYTVNGEREGEKEREREGE